MLMMMLMMFIEEIASVGSPPKFSEQNFLEKNSRILSHLELIPVSSIHSFFIHCVIASFLSRNHEQVLN